MKDEEEVEDGKEVEDERRICGRMMSMKYY